MFYFIKRLDFDVSHLFHFRYILLFGTAITVSQAWPFYKAEKLLPSLSVGGERERKATAFFNPSTLAMVHNAPKSILTSFCYLPGNITALLGQWPQVRHPDMGNSEPLDIRAKIPTTPGGSASGQHWMPLYHCCCTSPEVSQPKLPENSPPALTFLFPSPLEVLLHPAWWSQPEARGGHHLGEDLLIQRDHSCSRQAPRDSSRLHCSVFPCLQQTVVFSHIFDCSQQQFLEVWT